MRVVGRQRLDDLCAKHPEARRRANAWLVEVEDAEWSDTHAVRRRYPSASFLGEGRVVFNLGGNRFRIDAKINYRLRLVVIVRAGTHADYDSWTF